MYTNKITKIENNQLSNVINNLHGFDIFIRKQLSKLAMSNHFTYTIHIRLMNTCKKKHMKIKMLVF